jgi:predicted RNase H-like nuclease (RuvC/YqgF family)
MNTEKQSRDLLSEIDALNKLTAKTQLDFADIVKNIEDTKTEKAEAKKSYQEFLDQGDANKMQAALDRIRKANSRIDELTAEMKSFQSKVMELRKAQAALVEKSRELREKANIALKEARERQVTTESFDNACLASAGFISDLDLAINQATAKK